MNRIAPNQNADRPRLIAFGGGKGGAGRSTLTAEAARTIARHDNRVLCVDAAWDCPTLNTLLKTDEPSFDFSDGRPALGEEAAHVADFIENSGADNIWLLSLAAARRFPFVRPDLRPEAVIGQLHELDFDWILVDLPAGLDPLALNLFVLSDIPVVVATPEPAAVRTSTQFLRSALFQAVGYHPDAGHFHDELVDLLHAQPLRMNLSTLVDRAAPELADGIRQMADRLETYVVVNLVREGAEQDLGHVLCHAWREELGLFPRSLSHVEYESRRWFYHRRTSGGNSVRGDEKLSRDIEQFAKTLMDISIVDGRFPRPVPRDDEPIHPALYLGINPDTGRNEVRQHCRRLWEGFGRESAVEQVFDDPDKRARMTDELESLYRQVLQLPADSFKSIQLGSTIISNPEADAQPATPSAETSGPPTRDRTAADGTQTDEPTADRTQTEEPADTEPADEPGAATQNARPSSAGDEPEAQQPPETTDAARAAELPQDGAPTIPKLPRSKSPGVLVEKLRRRAGVSLHELSMQTQIGVKYLTAIEDVELDVLPRQVYLRNYLREVAKAFDVDPDALVREYFELLDGD